VKQLRNLLDWFLSLFRTRYEIIVSFDTRYGNNDDQKYIAKKLFTQTEKHLKFRTEEDQMVEFKSSSGLNYIIKEL
tara:strand:- start:657 stop:884 length:228 start_codon:yes stop_codon:yes gene_type:complete